ncbi:MAG: hypothetical protein LKM34_03155 [Prevotella sp.]|jgi:hypothetical protein|nr:hypothetical protein [Prevotella sp.]
MKAVLEQYGIEVGVLQETEDYWCRDYMPLQVAEDRFVKYRYFPNYLDKPKLRRYRTEVCKPWSHLCIDDKCLLDLSDITLDGGNMVKTPYIGFANKLASKRLSAVYQYVRCTFCKNKVSGKRQSAFPFLYRNANFTS